MQNEIGSLVFIGGPAIELDRFRGSSHGLTLPIEEFGLSVQKLIVWKI